MRRLLGGLTALLLSAAGGTISAVENPEWCRAGYVCVTREEMKRDIEYHIELRERVSALSVKTRRLGVSLGCGFGVAGVVDSEWHASVSPAGFCGVVYGYRW